MASTKKNSKAPLTQVFCHLRKAKEILHGDASRPPPEVPGSSGCPHWYSVRETCRYWRKEQKVRGIVPPHLKRIHVQELVGRRSVESQSWCSGQWEGSRERGVNWERVCEEELMMAAEEQHLKIQKVRYWVCQWSESMKTLAVVAGRVQHCQN